MVLVGKLEGKRPHARPMHIWTDNGKADLQETDKGTMNWIDLAQDMDGSCEHGNEPSGTI